MATIQPTKGSKMTEQQMEIVRAAEKDADDFGVDALTACAWALTRAERDDNDAVAIADTRAALNFIAGAVPA